MCICYFVNRQFGQFDYGQGYNVQYQSSAQYYSSAGGYSGSILTPDMNMSYTQAADTNFDDEPPLLEGELTLCILLYLHFCDKL